jgi:hypothetical protein
MSAEIGGYQGDEQGPNGPDHMPDFADNTARETKTSA